MTKRMSSKQKKGYNPYKKGGHNRTKTDIPISCGKPLKSLKSLNSQNETTTNIPK